MISFLKILVTIHLVSTIIAQEEPIIFKTYGIVGYGLILYCNQEDKNTDGKCLWELPQGVLLTSGMRQDGCKLIIDEPLSEYTGEYKCNVNNMITYSQEVIIATLNGEMFQGFSISLPAATVCSFGAKEKEEFFGGLVWIWCDNNPSCFYAIKDYRCLDHLTFYYKLQPVIKKGYIFEQCKTLESLVTNVKNNIQQIHIAQKNRYKKIIIDTNYKPFKKTFEDLIPNTISENHPSNSAPCPNGYEKSFKNLFCIPCSPGTFSSQLTSFICVKCNEDIYQRFYAQTQCIGIRSYRLGQSITDYTAWVSQKEVPIIYGLSENSEILHCNPDEPISAKNKKTPEISFKWQTPSDHMPDNFEENEDVLIIKEGSQDTVGIYTCTVSMKKNKTIAYKQEVLFVENKASSDKLSLSFPVSNCDESNREQISKTLQQLWSYPYNQEAGFLNVVNINCNQGYTYNFTISPIIRREYTYVQCKDPECLMDNIEKVMQQNFASNSKHYEKYVLQYFTENKKENNHKLSTKIYPVLKKMVKPCENGFGVNKRKLVCIPCRPGYYSKFSLELQSNECLTCPIRTYQTKYRQTMCERCKGNVTESRTKCIHIENKSATSTKNPVNSGYVQDVINYEYETEENITDSNDDFTAKISEHVQQINKFVSENLQHVNKYVSKIDKTILIVGGAGGAVILLVSIVCCCVCCCCKGDTDDYDNEDGYDGKEQQKPLQKRRHSSYLEQRLSSSYHLVPNTRKLNENAA